MLRVSALFAALATCYGWHTIAHTLISQVAQLSLTESEKKTLSMLLDDWQPFFPNSSDLTTAAVWLDMAKCDRDEQDCKFASEEHRLYAGAVADRKFSSWHYADVAINPDGVELSEEEQDIYAEDHIVWALGETLYSLGTSTNLWALNLNLRYMLHLMGDIHQPLHASGMYAKPGNPWAGPDGQLGGDAGGGFTFFDAKASNLEWEAAGNLHDFWDAAGGLYYNDSWPLVPELRAFITSEAVTLTDKYPKDFFPEYETIEEEFKNCWASLCEVSTRAFPPRGLCPEGQYVRKPTQECKDVFAHILVESSEYAKIYAYNDDLVFNGPLTPKYRADAKDVCQKRITLAGYRLADALKKVAGLLKEFELKDDEACNYEAKAEVDHPKAMFGFFKNMFSGDIGGAATTARAMVMQSRVVTEPTAVAAPKVGDALLVAGGMIGATVSLLTYLLGRSHGKKAGEAVENGALV